MFKPEIETIAKKTIAKLERLGVDYSISKHNTSAGYSVYISAQVMLDGCWAGGKVRISDHSVGCFRMMTDNCAYASNQADADRWFDKVVNAIESLRNAPVIDVWRRCSRKCNDVVDINEYDLIELIDTGMDIYTAKRKADGTIVKLSKKQRRSIK